MPEDHNQDYADYESEFDQGTPMLQIEARQCPSQSSEAGRCVVSIAFGEGMDDPADDELGGLIQAVQEAMHRMMAHMTRLYGEQRVWNAIRRTNIDFTGAAWSDESGDEGVEKVDTAEAPKAGSSSRVSGKTINPTDWNAGLNTNSVLRRMREMREDGCTGLAVAVDFFEHWNPEEQDGVLGDRLSNVNKLGQDEAEAALSYLYSMLSDLVGSAVDTFGDEQMVQRIYERAEAIHRLRHQTENSDEGSAE